VKECVRFGLWLIQTAGKIFSVHDSISDFLKIESGIHGKLLTQNNEIYKFIDSNFGDKDKLKNTVIERTSQHLVRFKDRVSLLKHVRN